MVIQTSNIQTLPLHVQSRPLTSIPAVIFTGQQLTNDRSETCSFLPGFFSPIIPARSLQLCGESFGQSACTHRMTAECIFMKFGPGELFEHLASHLNFHIDRNILCLPYANIERNCFFFGPKRLSYTTNFVPHANVLRCCGFKTTELRNASRLFHECVLSRQQYFD
jgi:hypothetical protein